MMLAASILDAVAAACAMCWIAAQIRKVSRRRSPGMLQRTETDLAQLFIFVSVSRLRIATCVLVSLVLASGWLLEAPWLASILLAGSVAMLPRVALRVLRNRWRRRLATQLPDALALWAGLLKAGQAMAPALAQLASRQPAPLGAELRLVLAQHRLGVGLDAAVAQFRDRASVPDLRMLATLLRAQRELGGNLAEALERLAATLRSRLSMEARIHSLTAQGRLQGVVVGALPLVLAAVLSFMEPEAMKTLVTTPTGWAAVAIVVALEIAGYTLIRRIVNIDV